MKIEGCFGYFMDIVEVVVVLAVKLVAELFLNRKSGTDSSSKFTERENNSLSYWLE